MNDYESELIFSGPDVIDFDWYKYEILNLPTEDLENKYDEYLEQLLEHRKKEPAKKRRSKSRIAYSVWIAHSQCLQDMLEEIAQELQNRKEKSEMIWNTSKKDIKGITEICIFCP